MSAPITIGTPVKFALGSEPHAFSVNPEMPRVVTNIAFRANQRGVITHTYIALDDGQTVSAVDLVPETIQ